MGVRDIASSIVLAILLVTAGCAGIPLAPKNVQDAVRQFTPPANMSYIYVARPWRILNGGVDIIAKIDDQPYRKLGNGTFLFFEVEPKRLHEVSAVMLFWPGGNKPSVVQLDCVPGKSYFLLAWVKGKNSHELRILTEKEGQTYVSELDMVRESDIPSGL